ncbi:hypothetical protein FOXB_06976 [Fusarium oxysporum f. sp. conglutinans Fo5176]|uniref:Uncharacterized protein n=2 Tax=Fusarium oxysporum f. sp. conglutinans TaxID=100902 RepID=F9FKP7_FUSOF|nr:hypothetical protein FOXB_06976 [Fusarium oxysporum f. sp. conglutinans Fo5176]KAG6996660.1 hypothetical protein FocnCong_v015568 [Fusarium oxysporum f. sp. conglutinans]
MEDDTGVYVGWEAGTIFGVTSRKYQQSKVEEDGLQYVPMILSFIQTSEVVTGADLMIMTPYYKRFLKIKRNGIT